MKLREQVEEAVAAAISGIWIRSNEHDTALQEIAGMCERRKWTLYVWDAENGMHQPQDANKPAAANDTLLPVPALIKLRKMLVPLPQRSPQRPRVVLVMRDVHNFISVDKRVVNPMLLQAIRDTLRIGSAQGGHLVVLSCPGIGIPLELEKVFQVVDHDLPDAEERWQLLEQVEEADRLPTPNSAEGIKLRDIGAGLTRLENVNALSRSIARHAEIRTDTVMELKEEMVRQTGLLTFVQPSFGFDMLGGLNHIKQFCLRGIETNSGSNPKARSRGVMAVGVPGSGKSRFARALAYETGRPELELNIGDLMGGIIGQTESRTKQAFAMIDAFSPCILFVD